MNAEETEGKPQAWTFLRYVRAHAAQIAVAFVGFAFALGVMKVAGLSMSFGIPLLFLFVLFGFIVLVMGYRRSARFYNSIIDLSESLDKPWQLTAMVEDPDTDCEAVVYEALQAMAYASAQEVQQAQSEMADYREYVELWVHEVKAPLAASGLIAARLQGEDASALKHELERIDREVEQALYFARSSALEDDFSIKRVRLRALAETACKKNARLLIEKGCMPTFHLSESVEVLADEKWMVFVIGQMLANSVRYDARNVRFSAQVNDAERNVVFCIADDGCGIAAEDVPRVFNKGFTGINGRSYVASTGMGLYLAAVLCQKMSIGLEIASAEGEGTRLLFTFPLDRERLDIQSERQVSSQ